MEQVKDSLQWCELVGWRQPPGKKETHMGPSMPFLPFLVLGDSAGRTPFLFDTSAREVLVAHARHPVVSTKNAHPLPSVKTLSLPKLQIESVYLLPNNKSVKLSSFQNLVRFSFVRWFFGSFVVGFLGPVCTSYVFVRFLSRTLSVSNRKTSSPIQSSLI